MKKQSISFEKIVIVIGIIVIIYALYSLVLKNLFKNKYQKMEENMVQSAKSYVIKNQITTDKEIYFDVTKLGVTLDSSCSIISGVIYDGKDYKPYLSCDEYKSKVIDKNIKEKDIISLKGDEVVVLVKGMTFYDPGYNSNDNVVKVGNIGTEEGVYNIFYKTSNSSHFAIRKIIIVNNQEIRDLFPVITLNGESVVYLIQGKLYQEQGYVAIDKVDGNITNKIKVDDDINNNFIGDYSINYSVTNSRGYTSSVTRKVYVIGKESDLVVKYTLSPQNLTNGSVNIVLSLNGEYDHIVYPNGQEGKDLNYNVTDNGTYNFYVYDKYQRMELVSVNVNNIDKDPPRGTCVAETFYDRTEITTKVESTREVSSYDYIINNETFTSQTNKYTSKITNPASVKVKIKDIINNSTEINCTIKNGLVKKIVTNSKGKNCLEGYYCYVQYDYNDTKNYPYCSMPNNPSTCNGISHSGCSITAVTIAIASLGAKSKNGNIFNPYTIWEEAYPINKKTGECNGGCSGWTRMKEAAINAGLSAGPKVIHLNKNSAPQLIEHLKKGFPAVVHAGDGPYARQRGHYLAILGIREDNYVFLSDPGLESGTLKEKINGKQYYADTWVPVEDLISGKIDEFLLVAPKGVL